MGPERISTQGAQTPDMPLAIDYLDGAIEVAILLLPGFELFDLAATTDILAATRKLEGVPRIRFWTIGLTREPVIAGDGSSISPHKSIADKCAAGNIIILGSRSTSPRAISAAARWVRSMVKPFTRTYGIGLGVVAMAEANLLDGVTTAMDWRLIDQWQDAHPEVRFQDRTWIRSSRVGSCLGFEATIMLWLELIGAQFGRNAAKELAHALNYPWSDLSRGEGVQWPGAPVSHPAIRRAIHSMKRHLEKPLGLEELCEAAGLNTARTLERLFRQHTGKSPMQLYRQFRLEYARHLLANSDLSIQEVALAAGFKTPSHFGRSYKACFSASPGAWRQDMR